MDASQAIGVGINILILAGLVEGLVEFFIAPVLEPLKKREVQEGDVDWRVVILRVCSLGAGLLASFAFGIDILAEFGVNAAAPWIGMLASGFIIARGSNYTHDLVGKWSAK